MKRGFSPLPSTVFPFSFYPPALQGDQKRGSKRNCGKRGEGKLSSFYPPFPHLGNQKRGGRESLQKYLGHRIDRGSSNKAPSANGQMGEERPVMPQSLPGISSLSFPHRRFAPDRSEAAFPERDTKAKRRIGGTGRVGNSGQIMQQGRRLN